MHYQALTMKYRQQLTGSIISFRGGSLAEQRRYIWNMLSVEENICLYVDWEDQFSMHTPPPPYAHVLCVSAPRRDVVSIIEIVHTHVQIEAIIIDPLQDIDKIPLGWMYSTIKTMIRKYNIKLYLLFDPEQKPLFQAQVYIDLRRCHIRF